jgi:hypothetical protein
MAIDHKQRHHTIAAGPRTELGTVLDLADDAPVVIDRNGVRYHVQREGGKTTTSPDPGAFRDALRRSAGTLDGIDGDQLKRDLRRQRGHDDDDEV